MCPGQGQTCQVSRYETGMLTLLRQPVSSVFTEPEELSLTQGTVQVLVTSLLTFLLCPASAVADGCPGSRTEHDSGERWPRSKWYVLWHFLHRFSLLTLWAGAKVLVPLSPRNLSHFCETEGA